MLGNIDSISGAKRKENLTNHAEDARVSKTLATAIRDIDLGEIDLDHIAAREPDRSRLRETFREFELRAPLERLEEALGEGEAAAPAERAEEVVHTKARSVPLAEIGALEGELVALATQRPRPAGEQDGQETLDVGGPPLGPMEVAAYAGGEVLVAEAETLTALTMALAERPMVTHDWKTTAVSEEAAPAVALEHDTMIAAYLIDPARRGYPLDELSAEAGIAAAVEGANGIAERAVVTRVLAERQRARLEEDGLTRLFHEVELPLVDVLVEMERAGVKLDVERLRGHLRALRPAGGRARAPRLGPRGRGVHDRLAAAARPHPVREARAVAASGAARPGSPPTRACCRRSATSTRSSRRSRSGARSRS